MDVNFIKRTLGFHGQPLQMIWEDEMGAGHLQRLGVSHQIDYTIYQERQKYFTFQDRAKRLKLHQFFARKANDLYDTDLHTAMGVPDEKLLNKAKPLFATTPPYEAFVSNNLSRNKRWCALLEAIQPGDIVYGVVAKVNVGISSLVIKPHCTAEPLVRYLHATTAKAIINANNLGTMPLDARGAPRRYAVNEYVCCAVLEVCIDADRLYLSMENSICKNKNIKLGLVAYEDLPAYYHQANKRTTESYVEFLKRCKEFLNPNCDVLFSVNGLNPTMTFTMMNSLKYPFPREHYAKELRQTQARQWAHSSVVQGITLFKDGLHTEAFQALNKALSIDTKNVEGLVARGALYANKRNFLKAIDDFQTALNLAPQHANARNYIAETLIALGRHYEEQQKIPDAIKAYRDCLKWAPTHRQALTSIIALQARKSSQPYLHLINEIAGSAAVPTQVVAAPVITGNEMPPSTSNAVLQGNDDNTVNDGGMSPLSKRMALHAAALKAAENAKPPFHQPFYMASTQLPPADTMLINDVEGKIAEEDTLSTVRKLLKKATKHKKEKEKSKSSKKKKHKSKSRSSTPSGKQVDSMQLDERSLQLKSDLERYDKSIAALVKRQETLKATMAKRNRNKQTDDDSPPPPAPSMRPSNNTVSKSTAQNNVPKLSFQIRRPVKVDKFGLVRIATPLTQRSATPSRSRSRSRSRRRSRSSRDSVERRYRRRKRSSSRRRRSRTYSRSRSRSRSNHRRRSRSRRRRRYSRSYTRSRSRARSYDKRRNGGSTERRRRSPSPFVSRSSPSPNARGRKSSSEAQKYEKMNKATSVAASVSSNMDDPSIEEIDELINRAQKERKQEILKRNKDILKKSNKTNF